MIDFDSPTQRLRYVAAALRREANQLGTRIAELSEIRINLQEQAKQIELRVTELENRSAVAENPAVSRSGNLQKTESGET